MNKKDLLLYILVGVVLVLIINLYTNNLFYYSGIFFSVLLGGGDGQAVFQTGSSNKILPDNGDDFKLETSYDFICSKGKLAELLPYSHFANQDMSPSSGYAEQYFQAPQPIGDCWEAKLLFNGEEIKITDGKRIELGPYANMTFKAMGKRYVRFMIDKELEVYLDEPKAEDAPDLQNYRADYYFDFSQEDFLTATFKETEPILLLNSEQFAEVEVCNDFSNNIEGGLHVYTERETLFRTPEHEKLFFTYKKGCQIIKVPLKDNELGGLKITVQPFLIFKTEHVKYGCMVYESETDCDQYGWIPEIYKYELVQTTRTTQDYRVGVNANIIIPEEMRCEDKECTEGTCTNIPFIDNMNKTTDLKVCLTEQEVTKGPLVVKEETPDLTLVIMALIIIAGIIIYFIGRRKK